MVKNTYIYYPPDVLYFLAKAHIIKLTVAENLSIVSLRVRGHWVEVLGLTIVSND
jgi:hypothetical protein